MSRTSISGTAFRGRRVYFELYEHTARDLKSVSPRLRVGGPATAAAAWVDDFLKYAAENHVPVDFVSTHGYADDTVEDLFGTNEDIPDGRSRVPRGGEGAEADPSVGDAEAAAVLDRVECAGHERSRATRRMWARRWRIRSASATARWT